MKRSIMLFLFLLGLCLNLKAQDYDYNKLPKSIQQKVDQNKAEGKELFSGINTFYNIQFEDMDDVKIREKFKSKLPDHLNVVLISYNGEKNHVRVEMKGNVSPERFKNALGEMAPKITILTEQNFVLAK